MTGPAVRALTAWVGGALRRVAPDGVSVVFVVFVVFVLGIGVALGLAGSVTVPAAAASATPAPAGHVTHVTHAAHTPAPVGHLTNVTDAAPAAAPVSHVAQVAYTAHAAAPVGHATHAGPASVPVTHVADAAQTAAPVGEIAEVAHVAAIRATHPTHAKVTGSEPADGEAVDAAPGAVTLSVDAKPATIEGDPLRVYGPDGRRVDDGRPIVSDEGRRISVELDPTLDQPAGRYEIVYRIVSADTHLIAGRLSFSTRTAVQAIALAVPTADGSGRSGMGRLVHGWPEQAWPPVVAGGALLLTGLRLGWRRRRTNAAARQPLLPPMQGHLVAARTAYRPRSQPRTSAHHPRRVDRARTS